MNLDTRGEMKSELIRLIDSGLLIGRNYSLAVKTMQSLRPGMNVTKVRKTILDLQAKAN
jgi:hypothetical protein|tara:strand:+ start:7716 stop:7892 length:177 start_codon:yes stop_codon:yes gene_type:complete